MNRIKYAKSLLAIAIAASPMISMANEAVQEKNAQEESAPEKASRIEKIIVSAQKTSEPLSQVPIALSAFTGDFIQKAKVNDVKQIVRFTPGLSGESTDSFIDSLSVRGISTNGFGIGGDSSLGIYKDGIYFGRNGAAVASFFDVERVEVLKGPQGLLFGRNAASGAIHTITAKPVMDYTEGYFRLGAGERGRQQAEFAFNQPLADGWAMRIAGIHSEEDGFVENLYNNKDIGAHDRNAMRLSIKNEGDWGDVTLSGEYEDRKQYGSIYMSQDIDGNLHNGDNRTANLDWPGKDNAEVSSVTLTANINIADNMTLTSITGFNKHDWLYQEDWDGTPISVAGYVQDQEGEYLSQELRLNVQASKDLKWYIGASVYQEDISALLSNQTGDLDEFFGPGFSDIYESNYSEGDYSGWAIYGDMTYQLTDKMDFSLGLRYTYDEKEIETDIQGQGIIWGVQTLSPVTAKQDWDDLSPRVTLRYFPEESVMIFASVSEGYKSGGFGTDTVTNLDPISGQPTADSTLEGFDKESVLSYEIGTKGSLVEGQISYGISAYYYDYQDLQMVKPELGKLTIDNVGQVDGFGVEFDLVTSFSDYWDVFLGVAWSETESNDIPLESCSDIFGNSCNGNRLAYNPEWNISGGINTYYPLEGGEIVTSLDFSWQSEFYSTLSNNSTGSVDSTGFVNLRTGWESEQDWSLTFYVENIFDEESFAASNLELSLGFHTKVGATMPRTAGVEFMYSF